MNPAGFIITALITVLAVTGVVVPLVLLLPKGGGSVLFQFQNNQTLGRRRAVADPTMLGVKLTAIYLAEDVDPITQNNLGQNEMVWLNPQCNGDIANCNVANATNIVTTYFDLDRSTADVNADLNSQLRPVALGTYRYVRMELCKLVSGVNNWKWQTAGMTTPNEFSMGECGVTSKILSPPLVITEGSSVLVSLSYDLTGSVSNDPTADGWYGINQINGTAIECVTQGDSMFCLRTPLFVPSAIVI